MKITLRGVSGAALLFGLAGVQPALAQQSAQPAQPKNQTVRTSQPTVAPADLSGPQVAQTGPQAAPPADKPEKVIVTGSLIATTPEDAPKPVEVYTNQDLKEQGSPSVSEFVRSLSVSYGSNLGFGQATPEVPTGSGFTSADIRGLGPNATLTLINGRRAAAANGGFGADLNTIPTEALEAVEVLKSGASSTYGAGAVGGVLNFRTRRDIKGPQFSYEKTFYDGGDGIDKFSFLDGWKGDAGNLMITFGRDHEGAMLQNKRDWANLPFNVNPALWSLTAANPGGFNIQTSPFLSGAACVGTINGNNCAAPPVGTAVGFQPVSTVTFNPAVIEDLRNATDCTALGGQIANVIQPGAKLITTAANNGCAFPQAGLQDLVSDSTTYRAYAEFNANLSDTMEVHFNVTYSKNETIDQRIPDDPPIARATDGLIGPFSACALSATTQYGCYYVVPTQVSVYDTTATGGRATATSVRNPFVDDFIARTGAAVPDAGALYLANNYRPFLFGGDPLWGNGLRHDKYDRERVLVNAGMNGEFRSDGIFKFLNGITYDFNGQFDQYYQTNMTPDIIVSRLQAALEGYGGPGCNAIDRVPTDFSSAANFNRTIGIQSNTPAGTGGCQWFNPFASAFPTSVVNGAANPQYNSGAIAGRASGYQNPKDLIDWMTANKQMEDLYQTGTFDFTFTGELPKWATLPGGKIGWAAGIEERVLERRSMAFDSNRSERFLLTQQCPYPDISIVESPVSANANVGGRGCPTSAGAYYGTGVANITLNNVPIYSDSQVLGYYAEFALPVTDKLNFNISARHEDYNGGDLSGNIYDISGKYQITNNFYVRAAYGTNYRADAALDLHPGQTTESHAIVTRFSTVAPTQYTTVNNNIGPEHDVTQNYGVGYKNNDLFGGRFNASLDFFQAEINGQVATTSSTTIYNNVFGLNTTAGQTNRGVAGIPNTALTNSAGQFADCNARLIVFLAFNSACVQGVTTAADLAITQLFQQNGPGFTTNGLDYSADYTHPLFDGSFGASVTATENLVYKADGYEVNGVQFQNGTHNLGYANFSKTGGIPSSRWKANAAIRWANDHHNINFRVNYQSGMYDERYDAGLLVPITITPTSTYSTYGVFRKSYTDFDLVYIYTPEWMKGLELRAQVLNLTDQDPVPAQFRSGYLNGLGDPRGREFVLGATKKF